MKPVCSSIALCGLPQSGRNGGHTKALRGVKIIYPSSSFKRFMVKLEAKQQFTLLFTGVKWRAEI